MTGVVLGGRPGDRDPEDFASRVIVFTCWLSLTALALGWCARYSTEVPVWDDYFLFLPAVTGDQPITISWLLSPHGGHRAPLIRLLLTGFAIVSGGRLRPTILLNVLLLSFAAFAAARACRRRRGRAVLADALFPLALLNPSVVMACLTAFQLHFILNGLLLVAVVFALTRDGFPRKPRDVLPPAASCLGLLLLGSTGLPTVPWFAAWMLARGLRGRDLGRATRRVLAVSGATLLAMAGAGLAFVTAGDHRAANLADAARTATQFLSSALGSAHAFGWSAAPFGLGFPPVLSIGYLALVAGAAVLAACAFRHERRIDGPGARHLVLVAALLSLAASVGWGRGGFGPGAGLAGRYSLLSLAGLVLVNLTFDRLAGPRLRALVGTGLVLFLCVLSSFHAEVGFRVVRRQREIAERVLEAVRKGLPPAEVAAACAPGFIDQPEKIVGTMEMLERARLGPYRDGR